MFKVLLDILTQSLFDGVISAGKRIGTDFIDNLREKGA